ncbi:unnamed protein product [Urochloa humidicola]
MSTDRVEGNPRPAASPNTSSSAKLRREKISESMKLLQDLIPGCSKVNLQTKRARATGPYSMHVDAGAVARS